MQYFVDELQLIVVQKELLHCMKVTEYTGNVRQYVV
jgi:hypothetical protein